VELTAEAARDLVQAILTTLDSVPPGLADASGAGRGSGAEG
jgi:hypothetical protein